MTLCVGAMASATTPRAPSAASVTRASRPRPPAGSALVRSLPASWVWARERQALRPFLPSPPMLAVLDRSLRALLLKCSCRHGSIMGPLRVGKEGRFQLHPPTGTLARLVGKAWPHPTSRGSKHINGGSTLLQRPQSVSWRVPRMCTGRNPSSVHLVALVCHPSPSLSLPMPCVHLFLLPAISYPLLLSL